MNILKILLILCATSPVFAQQSVPEIPFETVPNFLKYSPDMNLGEILGVAVNSQGNIVVLNHPGSANAGPIWSNSTTQLLEFDATGRYLREIGKGVYGIAYAHQVRFDENDNLWVVDKAANTVIQFDPQGYVLMNLGRREEGYHGDVVLPTQAEARAFGGYLGGPTDVAWDSAENIYISDGYVNSRMAKFDRDGNFVMDWGSYGSDVGQFDLPHAMQIDRNDNIYVADRANRRIQVFDTDGNYVRMIVLDVPYPPGYQPPFGAPNPNRVVRETQPWAMCISNTTPQYLYVADNEPGRIYKISTDGTILGWLGKSGRRDGQFNWVHGLDCSQEDVLYVADMNNWRVQKLLLNP
ncbi:MAG: peptidyl-alpha-hydroxyglycine alpha-amidating lyase family protein [Proteobacteria bacterium]|nr:peptidyl-alpha-hydroxyglycine alpha-amidating lyase family protein [Pseudomonadota bacterium]